MLKLGAAIVGLGMAHGQHLQSLRDLASRADIALAYSPSLQRRQTFAAANPDLAAPPPTQKRTRRTKETTA